ncbi:MAG: hypothetical protein ACHQFW_10230 [Chitinophagales bacterium]
MKFRIIILLFFFTSTMAIATINTYVLNELQLHVNGVVIYISCK